MQQLCNKRILLGITGGIAAYKAAELVRELRKAKAEVRVVMTTAAQEFITPLTLQALSGNPVHYSMLDPEAEAGMGHIELARWADIIVVAPATADFIARLTQGMGNDLLTTLCLASDAPLAICPAMNQAMWRDEMTQANIQRLIDVKGKKFHSFGPADGEQACGDIGPGRMLDPSLIAQECAKLFASKALSGLDVVITAGPTREAIDPVRFISNHSSGKMGYALAEAARDAGARVTIISGPVRLSAPEKVTVIQVESAGEMLTQSLEIQKNCDIFIAAAAVADYRPVQVAQQKIKKAGEQMQISLVKNPDIVATVAQLEDKPFVVGFAAETQDVATYARGKLVSKNLNLIIANDVSNTEIGFNSDNNSVTAFWGENEQEFPCMSKSALSNKLIELIAHNYTDTINSEKN
ncbi:MAG TPA: bifunctional phosphopantothenoylcysteine decarboxylase/phosphopantothenate--cysteine ligase CoaBC [Oceanospirillales bacterium]|nr:bifunctional phosphopantothenoylcysteine decarboxylase/phosphopantothenate--cysteine ligase CoaBC [Oceanospirillales bacterium]|tara:strand:+ start:1065 stop:2291 length:1227 start_codon:yes stop_codon:yes gene_type:complete